MEEDRTYIPDEQNNDRREEEEKDTGISPSVLDVRNYFDPSESLEKTEDKEPGLGNGEGEGSEEEKEKEGQEETQEEEAPEEPEEEPEEEHPKDDDEEMFQDRREQKIYTEEELTDLEEEPAEEEVELLIDVEEEDKKKAVREAKKRRADKLREYYKQHGQGPQEASSGAAGLESDGSALDGDGFYEERIRRAYGLGGEDQEEPLYREQFRYYERTDLLQCRQDHGSDP